MVVDHPAEAGWIVFAALTLIVTVYNSVESKLHALVAKTSNKTDDKILSFVSKVIGAIYVILSAIRLIVPHVVAQYRRMSLNGKENVDSQKEDTDV